MVKKQSFGQRHKYGVRQVVAGTVASAALGVGIAGAEYLKSNYDDKVSNESQPTCAIVPSGEISTVQDVRDLISGAGDNVQTESASIWTPSANGNLRQRTYQTDMVTGAGTSDVSIRIEHGDQVRIDHVDPIVCSQVGGLVLGNSTHNGAINSATGN